MHEAELDLAVALSPELGGQVRRPEALGFDLVLQRFEQALEPALVDALDDLEGPDLFADEVPHPLELVLELRLGLKVPAHQPTSRFFRPRICGGYITALR